MGRRRNSLQKDVLPVRVENERMLLCGWCLEGHYVLLVDLTQVKSANRQLLFGGTPGYIPVTSVDFYTHFYHLPG